MTCANLAAAISAGKKAGPSSTPGIRIRIALGFYMAGPNPISYQDSILPPTSPKPQENNTDEQVVRKERHNLPACPLAYLPVHSLIPQ